MADNEPILKPVHSILVSQPQPTDETHSPFRSIEDKYGVKITFQSFIQVEPVPVKEFRRNKIELSDYSAIILTTKYAVHHFFELCKEMRFKVSPDLKYFCLNEQISLYLQRYILLRKRKVFHGERVFADMKDLLTKNKKKERFFVPTSNSGSKEVIDFMRNGNFNFSEAMLYQTISTDLRSVPELTARFDMLVFFTAFGIKSLFENFPDFVQGDRRIACFSIAAQQAAIEHGLRVDIPAPTPEAPAITTAIDLYLQTTNLPVATK